MVLIVICIDPFGDPAVVYVLVVRSPPLAIVSCCVVVNLGFPLFLQSLVVRCSCRGCSRLLGCCIICGVLSLLGIYMGALSVSILISSPAISYVSSPA